jgi:radical SAM protein with 4Fe4S-binding SPASM domain
MCPIQFRTDGPPNGPPAFMPYDTFTSLVDQFDRVRELHLQGLGEPMMHPRFFDMVDYAAARGIRVSTNSNMTLLNDRRAERCVASGLDELHISLDGATAATYEGIRVRAHFDRVLRNIDRLLDARARAGSDTPRLRLVMVIMRRNLPELPDIVRLAHGRTIDRIFVQHLCHDFGESSLPAHYRPMREFVQAETLLEADADQVAHYFGQARAVAAELGVDLRLPRTQPRPHAPGTPGAQRCDWPWRGSYISYDGHAMPCCMVATPDRINFGKVDEQGIAATWNSPAYEEFRARLGSDDPPEICQSCAVYNGTF